MHRLPKRCSCFVLRRCRAVCVGEGEALWPLIVSDFRRGGVAGLQPYYREPSPGTYDLAAEPA